MGQSESRKRRREEQKRLAQQPPAEAADDNAARPHPTEQRREAKGRLPDAATLIQLSHERHLTGAELARACETHARTIYRVLEEAGHSREELWAPTPPEMEEIDFCQMPNDWLSPEDDLEGPPVRGKTVKVTKEMEAHLGSFWGRNTRFKPFTKGTMAMWRVLLREELQQLALAKAERQRTGKPVRPMMGPFYRAVAEELQLMKIEEAEQKNGQ